MNGFSALQSLLSLTKAPPLGDCERLRLYIGRDWFETHRDIRKATLCDGLPREDMRVLIRDRAFVLLGLESLAECTSEIVSAIAPMAKTLGDVDFAITTVSEWLVRLHEDGTFDHIVQLKQQADEVGLDEGPADSSPEAIEAWNEIFEAYCEDAEAGQICFEMGGRDIILSIEAQATVLMVETEPDTSDLEILVCFQHSLGGDDDGDGRDDGDDDPEPGPDGDPALPQLLDA